MWDQDEESALTTLVVLIIGRWETLMDVGRLFAAPQQAE